MGFFSRKKSTEELEEELEGLKIETESVEYRSHIAEREAVIRQLKKEYGPNWKKLLGVSKMTDLSTLRSFLTRVKGSMTTAYHPKPNPYLNPVAKMPTEVPKGKRRVHRDGR